MERVFPLRHPGGLGGSVVDDQGGCLIMGSNMGERRSVDEGSVHEGVVEGGGWGCVCAAGQRRMERIRYCSWDEGGEVKAGAPREVCALPLTG